MKSSLYGMQDVAIQIANTISVILQADVEIIDKNHMRVAGTGYFKNMVNMSNAGDGHAYKKVLQDGERLIVSNPGEDPECRGCEKRRECGVLLEIGLPVRLDQEIEGVIGITCWTEERLKFFMDNMKAFMYFLEQMAELVGGKLKERISLQNSISAGKMFRVLLRQIRKGVILLDSTDRIIQINEIARKELKLDDSALGRVLNVLITGDTITGNREYKLILDGEVFTVIGEEEILDGEDDRYSKILIFESIREYRNQVYNTNLRIAPHDINYITGHSESSEKLKKEILQAANNTSPVLLEGEAGSGKKVIGSVIWHESQRAGKPFVYFNCSSVSEEILEEKLFGSVCTEKEAALYGQQGQIGVLEMANDGILYMDEIDELSLYYQSKLERVLEEKVIQRKGSAQKIPINVRLIAATKRDLLKRVEKQKFRKRLYYMISICRITVLPLRKRQDDIEDFVHKFIQQYTTKYQVHFRMIDEETMTFLRKSPWYGNVVELEKTVEYMVNAMNEDGIIDMRTVPEEFQQGDYLAEDEVMPLEELEQREIRKAILKFGDSKKGKEKAAEALGIGIATLYRKLGAQY